MKNRDRILELLRQEEEDVEAVFLLRQLEVLKRSEVLQERVNEMSLSDQIHQMHRVLNEVGALRERIGEYHSYSIMLFYSMLNKVSQTMTDSAFAGIVANLTKGDNDETG